MDCSKEDCSNENRSKGDYRMKEHNKKGPRMVYWSKKIVAWKIIAGEIVVRERIAYKIVVNNTFRNSVMRNRRCPPLVLLRILRS